MTSLHCNIMRAYWSPLTSLSAWAPGATDGSLRLSADVLARIYMCNITRWNDPLIASLNPGARWASRTLWGRTGNLEILLAVTTCPAVLV